MTTEIDELRARMDRMESQHAAYYVAAVNSANREFAMRAALLALIYHLPPGVLTEDFSMFLDQVVSEYPPHLQKPDAWTEMARAIEDDRKPGPKG